MNKENLLNQIKEANKAYREGNSIMSDSDYDKLVQSYKDQFNEDPEAELEDDFDTEGTFNVKVNHRIEAFSQNKSHGLDELSTFKNKNKLNDDSLVNASLKLDGISLVCYYKDGKFDQAVTRGNGFTGVDVTLMAESIPSIPKTIPCKDEIAIRGECILSQKAFKEVNEILAKEGLPQFANSRNGGCSIAKFYKNRRFWNKLSFLAYEFKILS